MRISVCIDIMYKSLDFVDRIDAVKNQAFENIEFWGWKDKDINGIADRVRNLDMNVHAFCIDSRDENISELLSKYALNSGKISDVKRALCESIEIANVLETNNLIITIGDKIQGMKRDVQISNIFKCLESLIPVLEENNITLLVEPINCSERPNYILPDANDAAGIIKKIDSQNIKLLYDIYHQNAEGKFNLSEMIDILPLIGHIHAADYPGRGEPYTGLINYRDIFKSLRENGYSKTVGLEYIPSVSEEKSFEVINSII